MGEFLYGLASGSNPTLKAKKGFQIGVQIVVPPFPFTDRKTFEVQSKDSVIHLKNGINGVHIADVKQINGEWVGDAVFNKIDFDYDIFPAYHLLDLEKYRSTNNIVSYFSTRGCPFQCSFCTTGDGFYSCRKINQIESEIDYLVNKVGFLNVFFQDGTFFVSKDRVLKIARLIKAINPNVKWKAKARVNSLLQFSKDELSFLHESGLRSIFFGVESGSKRILKNMNKTILPEQACQSAKICLDNGFEFYASFMFATPGETVDDLLATIQLIKRIKKINQEAVIQNCLYIPLPGTPMFDSCVDGGYSPPDSLAGWYERDISSNWENRTDINWIEPDILKEYKRIYNDEFSGYKHVYEREETGEYKSPLQ